MFFGRVPGFIDQARRFGSTLAPQLNRFGGFVSNALHTASKVGKKLSEGGMKAVDFVDKIPGIGEALGGVTGEARGILRGVGRASDLAGRGGDIVDALRAKDFNSAKQGVQGIAEDVKTAGGIKNLLTKDFEKGGVGYGP
jgi:hypothetical protein